MVDQSREILDSFSVGTDQRLAYGHGHPLSEVRSVHVDWVNHEDFLEASLVKVSNEGDHKSSIVQANKKWEAFIQLYMDGRLYLLLQTFTKLTRTLLKVTHKTRRLVGINYSVKTSQLSVHPQDISCNQSRAQV